jgi:hypothetical protein
MIVISPLALAMGSGALSFGQGMLANSAKQQEYVNQKAQRKANSEFASWSASRQQEQTDLNNQYSYWQQKINYGQEVVYANQLRNFELARSIDQAELVAQARAGAGANFMQASEATAEAFSQQSMADAVSLMQYKQQALRAQATTAAGLNAGVSSDRYLNDYDKQTGDMATLQMMNQKFRDRQYTRDQAGNISQYLNQYNSQQLYQMQDIQDPIMPFAPLPTLINPAGPSFVGAAPSASTAFLGSALGAVSAGINTYGAVGKYANSGKGTPPPAEID